MEKINYVDSLIYEILRANDEPTLLYLEDDVDMAIGLGQIKDRQDRLMLKLALQTRYSYVIFNGILIELNSVNNGDGGCILDFQKKMDEVRERHLSILDD